MNPPPYRQPRDNPALISYVIPLFNEQEVLGSLRAALEKVASELPSRVEWILVNDGSQDRTAEALFRWAAEDNRAKVLDLARNFGHQAAITAGVDFAIGEVVILMDGDLQDPPELALEMLRKYREGYDVVYAQRVKRRGETFFKRATAALFYRFVRRYVHPQLPLNTGDFRLLSRGAVIAFRQMREGQRFIRGMISWMGFAQVGIPYERRERAAGTTKFPLRKMTRFALDGIFSFSRAPLRIGLWLGAASFFCGLAVGVRSLCQYALGIPLVKGWTTLVVLLCILGGAILVSLGLIGEYVGRIYEEIKRRPIYLVRGTANMDTASLVLPYPAGIPGV